MLTRYNVSATADLEEAVGKLARYGIDSRHKLEIVARTENVENAEKFAAAQNADGATPQNRTGDTVIFSHVLYQLS